MRHAPRTTLLTFLILIALLTTLSTVTASQIAYRFGDYAPAGDMLYMETSSIESVIEQIKEFYRGLRPDTGENEILMLTAAVTQKLGFNPLDSGGLRSFGIDPKGPIAVTIEDIESFGSKKNIAQNQGPEKDWAAYIPAADSLKLYQSFHILIKRGLEKKFSQTPAPEGIITEISRNRLLHHKGAGFFFARGDRFCVFANSRTRALAAIGKSPAPLSRSPHHLRFRQLTDSRYTGSDVIMAYCLNRNGMGSFSFLQNFSGGLNAARGNTAATQMYGRLNDEINQHVLAEGGMFSFSRKKASMRSDAAYKEGYLSDRTKILPGLLSSPYHGLSADSFGKKPAMYGRIRVNLSGIMELAKGIIPDFNESFGEASRQIKGKAGVDIIHDCINKMDGNFAILLDHFPETAQAGLNQRWSFSFSAGYGKENSPEIKGFFESIANIINEENGNTTLLKEQHRDGILWSITSRKKAGGYNTFPDNQTPIIKETNYLYLGPGELIYSPERENFDRLMKLQSRKTVAGRLMNVPASREQNTNILFYIDMEALNRYVQNTPLKFLMGNAAPYLQNMESARIIFEISGNNIISESSLLLK